MSASDISAESPQEFRNDRPTPAAGPTLGGPGGTLSPQINPWVVAGVVTMAAFMEVLDTSIANVSLPHIAGNLSSSQEESTWVLTSYLVANAIVIPTSGWLSSRVGRKPFFMTCVTIFTISSALCGMATSLGMLVLCRVLQGLGGGGLQPSVQAVLVDLFPGKKRGMAMALYTVAVLVAPILGPTLGGWITDNYSWRWIFYINVPVGILCLMFAQTLLHDPPYLVAQRLARRGKPLNIDYIGLALISLGLACTEILLDKGQEEDWFASRLIITLAVVGGLAMVFAIVWELDHPHPILHLRLLAERNFMFCCVISVALYACVYACNVLLPQLMQTMMGYSPTKAGLILSPAGLFTMALVPFIGTLLARGVDPRILIGLGLGLAGAATLWMGSLDLLAAPSNILWPRVLQSCGAGMLFVPLSTIAFSYLPREESGNASALYALVRNEGSSIGVALVSTLLVRGTQIHQAMLVGQVSSYNSVATHTIGQISQATSTGDPTVGPMMAMRVVYNMVLQQASMLAYVDQFRHFGFLLILIIPIVFLLRKPAYGRNVSLEAAH
ncbi:MAG: DHA2 family efflux MFS transporter permease subunit [Tepidisphaeraceae bacterium]|jgi:DHA2 family multidrug resistance protein